MAVAVQATLPRLLAGVDGARALTLEEHVELHGPLPARGPDLIESLEQSGLRGRGGAGFPTATKMQAVASGRRTPVVVANGAEGEPASTKDRLIMEALPHLVLDGVELAAQAVGASEAIVCLEGDSSPGFRALRSALGERARAGQDPVPVQLVATPAHYLAGEESALVQFLDGGPLKPTFVPPRPFERGIGRRPTLIQNVETLAHVALIARHGWRWFRELGTASEPGSTLVTLSGAVEYPGVYEIARGTPLADLLGAAGAADSGLSGLLLGGYFGSWVDASLVDVLRLEDAELAAHGAALGSGVVVALPDTSCGPAEVARAARYLASQSAGQCGPCAFGLPAIAGALEHVVAGRADAQVWARVGRWLEQVNGRGACHHPNGAVRFVSSALRVFADQWEQHAAHGPCSACAASPVLPIPRAATRRMAA